MPRNNNHVKKAFVREYLHNGYNGTQAYLKIRPNVTYRTAQTSASDYLSNPEIQKEVQRVEERRASKSVASRERLIDEAEELRIACKENGIYNTWGNAIDLKAKLNRIYDKDTPDLQNYQTLIQSLTVNTINITPDDELSAGHKDKE